MQLTFSYLYPKHFYGIWVQCFKVYVLSQFSIATIARRVSGMLLALIFCAVDDHICNFLTFRS